VLLPAQPRVLSPDEALGCDGWHQQSGAGSQRLCRLSLLLLRHRRAAGGSRTPPLFTFSLSAPYLLPETHDDDLPRQAQDKRNENSTKGGFLVVSCRVVSCRVVSCRVASRRDLFHSASRHQRSLRWQSLWWGFSPMFVLSLSW
jgi:hypothetical protein